MDAEQAKAKATMAPIYAKYVSMSAEDLAKARAYYGLDKGIFEQYFDLLWRALHGDLGQSLSLNRPVTALLAELAVHRLDLVISDVPMPAGLSVKAFSHLLGRTDVCFFASPELLQREGLTLRQARARFPRCLGELPWLMPDVESVLRPRLDAWLAGQGVVPRIVAEFDDGALTKAFGRQGFGVFAGPAILAREIEAQFQVARLGSAPDLMEEFYAISIERRISNPAVAAITDAARRELFPRL